MKWLGGRGGGRGVVAEWGDVRLVALELVVRSPHGRFGGVIYFQCPVHLNPTACARRERKVSTSELRTGESVGGMKAIFEFSDPKLIKSAREKVKIKKVVV